MRRDQLYRDSLRRADAGVDSITVNGQPPGGITGPVAIVSPMAQFQAPNVVRIDNGNSKDLALVHVQADIDTDLNTAFKVAKLAGALVIAIPAVPAALATAEDRKITFEIQSRGNAADTVTFTGGAGGYEWANAAGVGPFVADFNALIAAMPNDSVCKVGFSFSNRRNRWVAVALAGYYP